MGIISRFKDIMGANINSVISSAEEKNADKILEKYLRDAMDDLQQVKSETAAVMADEMAASRQLNECNEQYVKYEKYASQAVIAGNDGDALKFLDAKNKLSSTKTELEKKYDLSKQNTQRMQEMTTKLAEDILAAQEKLKGLKSMLSVAKSTEKINNLNEKMSGNSLDGFESMAELVQKRIDAAQATSTLNKVTEKNNEVDKLMEKYNTPGNEPEKASAQSELEALKAKLGL